MADLEDYLKRLLTDAEASINGMDHSSGAKKVISQLKEGISAALSEIRNIKINQNDFSGDVRVQKAKVTELRKELRQKDEFVAKIIPLISSKVKNIHQEAKQISNSEGDAEKCAKSAKTIQNEIKDLVETIANKKGAA